MLITANFSHGLKTQVLFFSIPIYLDGLQFVQGLRSHALQAS